jgi:hypothetical protein
MAFYATNIAFNAGELSPRMLSRTDIAQYSRGCRTLENFLPTPYGSVERRPGLEILDEFPWEGFPSEPWDEGSGTGGDCRIIPFVVSSDAAYLVLLAACRLSGVVASRLHVWSVSASAWLTLDTVNDVARNYLETPYAPGRLSDIQYVQSADVMTLVDGLHAPMELRRTGEAAFELAEKYFETMPMSDADSSGFLCAFSADCLPSGGPGATWYDGLKYDTVDITASNAAGNHCLICARDAVFSLADIGSQLSMDAYKSQSSSGSFTGNGTVSLGKVKGTWTLTTHGTWTGTLVLQRQYSEDGNQWETLRTCSSSNDNNISASGKEPYEADYRLSMADYSAASTGTIRQCDWSFSNLDYSRNGLLEICEVQTSVQQIYSAIFYNTRDGAGTRSPILGTTDQSAKCRFALCRIISPFGFGSSLQSAGPPAVSEPTTAHSAFFDFMENFRTGSLTKAQLSALTSHAKYGYTDTWARSCWGPGHWPRAVAFFEERMMFGGTSRQPQTIWGSRTGDWDSFLQGADDDSPIEVTLYSDTINTIQWMCQQDALVVGTADAEWTLSASSSDAALTPSNIRVRRQSAYGSERVPAVMAGEVVLFLQRGARKLREFVYSWEKDGYTSPDMTVLAEHVTAPGMVSMALLRTPDTVLWCLMADGTLASLTYEREQEVVAWARHTTPGGKVASVCALPHGGEDRLCLIVRREAADGAEVLTVERMGSRAAMGTGDCVYLDCARVFTPNEGYDSLDGWFAMPGWMAGLDVSLFGDGVAWPGQTLDSTGHGLTPDGCRCRLVAGLGYASLLEPMPLEAETRNGLSLMRRKAVGEVRVRVYGSVGGQVRAGDGPWQPVCSLDVDADLTDSAPVPKDETVRVTPLGGYSDTVSVQVRQTEPLPLNVASVCVVCEVCE